MKKSIVFTYCLVFGENEYSENMTWKDKISKRDYELLVLYLKKLSLILEDEDIQHIAFKYLEDALPVYANYINNRITSARLKDSYSSNSSLIVTDLCAHLIRSFSIL